MSSDLQWELLRPHNALLIKRNGMTFSREPANLLSAHSKRSSGLVNSKAIRIDAVPESEQYPSGGVAVSFRKQRGGHEGQIASAYSKPTIINGRRGPRRAAKAVEAYLVGTLYRVDLIPDAKARVATILKPQCPRRKLVREARQAHHAEMLARRSRSNKD